MNKNLFTYTFRGFEGERGAHPIVIQIVASSEGKARKRILAAVQKENFKGGKSLDFVDNNIGCFCSRINEFSKPIFHSPVQNENLSRDFITFEQWIKIVPVKVRPFSLFEVKIYSCLDG